ncbi:MAG: LysE family translocator [Acidobacteriota bacterium]
MPDYSKLSLFVAAAFALLAIPGPAVLYIVARSIDQGRKAGIVSVLGVGVGALFHIAAAAFGLSALLLSSATAFNTVKYLGAAYLIYLGVRKLTQRREEEEIKGAERARLSRIFCQGVIVNVLNPKTALFFFAFLPQFVEPERGPVSAQILMLGAIFVVMGICSDGMYALMAGTLGRWIGRSARFLRTERYFAGSVYIALGLTTAFSGSKK